MFLQGDDSRFRQGLSEATVETQHVFSGHVAFSDWLQSWDAWSRNVFRSQTVNYTNDDKMKDYLYSKQLALLVAFRGLLCSLPCQLRYHYVAFFSSQLKVNIKNQYSQLEAEQLELY